VFYCLILQFASSCGFDLGTVECVRFESITSIICLQGIEFLVTNGLLQDDPESVAQFLHKGEGLNKTAIGDYLGER